MVLSGYIPSQVSFNIEKKCRGFTEQRRFVGKVVSVRNLVEPQERKHDCFTNQCQSRTRLKEFGKSCQEFEDKLHLFYKFF